MKNYSKAAQDRTIERDEPPFVRLQRLKQQAALNLVKEQRQQAIPALVKRLYKEHQELFNLYTPDISKLQITSNEPTNTGTVEQLVNWVIYQVLNREVNFEDIDFLPWRQLRQVSSSPLFASRTLWEEYQARVKPLVITHYENQFDQGDVLAALHCPYFLLQASSRSEQGNHL